MKNYKLKKEVLKYLDKSYVSRYLNKEYSLNYWLNNTIISEEALEEVKPKRIDS